MSEIKNKNEKTEIKVFPQSYVYKSYTMFAVTVSARLKIIIIKIKKKRNIN